MPAVGDTLVRFGRSYVYLNPEDSGGTPINARVGTYRLAVDDEYDGGGEGEEIDIPGTTGTGTVDPTEDAVILNELLYFGDNGNLFKAKADSVTTSNVVGVALETAAPGETVTFGTNVKIDIFDVASVVDDNVSGILSRGATYYLSAVNKGHWTLTPDTTTPGNAVIQCGVCSGTNAMLVEIQALTEI